METNLPEDIKERALSVFKSAVSQKFVVKDSIEKVQKEALSEIENVYKGKRFKVQMRCSEQGCYICRQKQ